MQWPSGVRVEVEALILAAEIRQVRGAVNSPARPKLVGSVVALGGGAWQPPLTNNLRSRQEEEARKSFFHCRQVSNGEVREEKPTLPPVCPALTDDDCTQLDPLSFFFFFFSVTG